MINYWGCHLSEQLLCRVSLPAPCMCVEGSGSVSRCWGWHLCRAWRAEGSRVAQHRSAQRCSDRAGCSGCPEHVWLARCESSQTHSPVPWCCSATVPQCPGAPVPQCQGAGLAAAGRSDWERTPPLGQTGNAIPGVKPWAPHWGGRGGGLTLSMPRDKISLSCVQCMKTGIGAGWAAGPHAG